MAGGAGRTWTAHLQLLCVRGRVCESARAVPAFAPVDRTPLIHMLLPKQLTHLQLVCVQGDVPRHGEVEAARGGGVGGVGAGKRQVESQRLCMGQKMMGHGDRGVPLSAHLDGGEHGVGVQHRLTSGANFDVEFAYVWARGEARAALVPAASSQHFPT